MAARRPVILMGILFLLLAAYAGRESLDTNGQGVLSAFAPRYPHTPVMRPATPPPLPGKNRPTRAQSDQGTSKAGTMSDVNSSSVRAPAPATLKLTVVTTTTTPCTGRT